MSDKIQEKRKIRQNLAGTSGVSRIQNLFVHLQPVWDTPHPGSVLQPWHEHPKGHRTACNSIFV